MRPRSAAGVLATSAALLFAWAAAPAHAGPGATAGSGPEGSVPERVRLLDVPFVPQSEALCGGAAAAMVLRYWGDGSARAEAFAALVEPDAAGIRTGALVEAVRGRGWTALPLGGSAEAVRGHLARGRPVIALLRASSRSAHYVVIVAWANGGVIYHDPAVAPFRAMRAAAFDAAWAPGGRWALLILPGAADSTGAGSASPGRSLPPESPDSIASAAPDLQALSSGAVGCDSIVAEGVRRARAGRRDEGEQWLRAAASLCPDSPAPWRELAGLRFAADDWSGASALADRALDRDPRDPHALRILAGSRFLAGDTEGALRVWNRLAEPRADIARIDGLERIRYGVVSSQLDLRPGRILTAHAYRRARHRIEEIPAGSRARLALRPLPQGAAQVTVTMVERPLLFEGPWEAGGAALRAAIVRGIELEVASPTGSGELWSGGWRWQAWRPRVHAGVEIPLSGGRTGFLGVESFWERQTYSARAALGSAVADEAGDLETPRVGEERRRAVLSFADWIGANLRVGVGAAYDRWHDRGARLSVETSLETRGARDRVSIELRAAGWTGSGAPFRAGSILARWGSHELWGGPWHARAGAARASDAAPLALWPGAGTGSGREALLRAHPLLEGGILDGPAFGPTLLHGGVERTGWAYHVGPARLGWALFLDTARAWDRADLPRSPWHLDGGAGIRIGGFGRGSVRVDAAHGFQDGAFALSARWQAR